MLKSADVQPPQDTMKNDSKEIDAILSVAGIVAPPGLLNGMDVESDLGRLDDVLALAAGGRQRLGEMLCGAGRITAVQLEEVLVEQAQTGRKLGDLLVERGAVTARERDIVLEFQRRQARPAPPAGKLQLGEILVRTRQITRGQLDEALRRQAISGRRLGDELVAAGHLREGQIEGGLLLQRKLVTYALTLAMTLASVAMPRTARADAPKPASVKLQIAARVAGFFRLQVQHQAAGLTLARRDIERGYIDVPAGSRFSVATNTRDGYVVDFFAIGDLFRAVLVHGLSSPVELNADGGSVTVVHAGNHSSGAAHELAYRFMLRPELQPGTYPWPLALSVHPI
jgi:hypothetical protein